jgi:hypothetical protein
VATHWRWLVQVIGLSVLAIGAYFVIPLDGEPAVWLAGLMVAGVIGGMLPLAIGRAAHVLESDHPFVVAVASLAQFITMLVVSFSTVYYVLGVRYDDQVSGIATKIDALYFTVVTLSTVGFGDITATGQAARAVVTVNILANVALLAVALRVVSWAWRERGGQESLRLRAAERRASTARSSPDDLGPDA